MRSQSVQSQIIFAALAWELMLPQQRYESRYLVGRQRHPKLRFSRSITDKGLDLWPMIVALMKWGDRYAPPEGGPAVEEVGRRRVPQGVRS